MHVRRPRSPLGRRQAGEDPSEVEVEVASGWLSLPDGSALDVAVKPAAYLPTYEQVLAPLRGREFTLLELGIWKGQSLEMWHSAFPKATIVGVDLGPPPLDLGPNVHLIRGDQSDAELMSRLRAEIAPDGFAVVIDDASHVGQLTARSLQALYRQHLQPGGLYIIEDWGTGYMSSWPDGGDPTAMISSDTLDDGVEIDGSEARRLPSHDFGMVGLIKRLIDHAASGTLAVHQPAHVSESLPIQWMRVEDGLVILKKPGALFTGPTA